MNHVILVSELCLAHVLYFNLMDESYSCSIEISINFILLGLLSWFFLEIFMYQFMYQYFVVLRTIDNLNFLRQIRSEKYEA